MMYQRNARRPHADFCFPIRRRSMDRINALRLAHDLDFWSAAAFLVFESARRADPLGDGLAIPEACRARAARRYAPAPGGVFGPLVPVRQADACPLVVAFLTRLGQRHGLTPQRAAMALADWWASGLPAWGGAPHV